MTVRGLRLRDSGLEVIEPEPTRDSKPAFIKERSLHPTIDPSMVCFKVSGPLPSCPGH